LGEIGGLDVLDRVHVFPVRHHSPRSALLAAEFLDEARPEAVLIEGPIDATPLVEVLTDPETLPPIAILGYRTDGQADSALWPFAAYSPEYAAMIWAKANGRRVELIDIPIGSALAAGQAKAPREERRSEGRDVFDRCADAAGLRSFEEFWEAAFEVPRHAPAPFRAALLAYADLVRNEVPRPIDRARDAHMAERIMLAIADGLPPEKIAVIAGAAHAAAFVAKDVDLAALSDVPKPFASAATVIPYSFPRLAEQLGYGAGNRAPKYYQRAHDGGCDFRRAALEVLVELTDHLRLRGFAASLADTIEAYRLALRLAEIRDKSDVGLDEIREAAIATLCRGEARYATELLWPSVIGRQVGKVASKVGRSSLEAEFWGEVRARNLPSEDHLEAFTLKLNNPTEVGTSIFLHRLRIAGVPYASFTPDMPGSRSRTDEEAGGRDALSRAREGWQAQWTPATDVALVEKIVFGDSLVHVAEHVLQERLEQARSAGEAAEVLLESVVAACQRTMASALASVDRLAAYDDDLLSLARAARALSGLIAYGSSRAHGALGDDAILLLLGKTYDRAVLRIDTAAAGDDESMAKVVGALRTLYDVARSQTKVDEAVFFEAIADLARRYDVNPTASGVSAGLLYLGERLPEGEVEVMIHQRLSNIGDPRAAAGFLAGFFEVNALVLVKSRAIVAALDGFLTALEGERFRDTLPILRRAFGELDATERRYLLENVLALRGLHQDARAAQTLIAETDKEVLRAMSEDVQKAMEDLDDLL
jgi:uncharacterized protein DUF5682